MDSLIKDFKDIKKKIDHKMKPLILEDKTNTYIFPHILRLGDTPRAGVVITLYEVRGIEMFKCKISDLKAIRDWINEYLQFSDKEAVKE